MIDEKLYRETFSRLQASGEAKKEVLLKMNEMKEKKTMRRPIKALRAAALAAALTVALAVTANAASDGMLLEEVLTIIWSDGLHQVAVDEDGNEWNLYSIGAGTEIRDGRVILSALGEETDITDALEESGKFTRDYEVEDFTATINVTGTPEEHFISLSTPMVTIQTESPEENANIGQIFSAESGGGGLTNAEDFEMTYTYIDGELAGE